MVSYYFFPHVKPCSASNLKPRFGNTIIVVYIPLENKHRQRASWREQADVSGLDDRQITHLICVRLKHLLHDFGGLFRVSFMLFLIKTGQNTPQKIT